VFQHRGCKPEEILINCLQVANGGVHVDWPGGMVNIGKKLMNAQEEITATGRILLETTNVDFPGGNVAVSISCPVPSCTLPLQAMAACLPLALLQWMAALPD
jgi:hypothetical protein